MAAGGRVADSRLSSGLIVACHLSQRSATLLAGAGALDRTVLVTKFNIHAEHLVPSSHRAGIRLTELELQVGLLSH